MNKKQKAGIYCIENITTNKKYIGQSIDIKNRWLHHKSELRNNKHDNDYLQNAWNKYGEDDFKFYILEHCTIDELNDKENYYIEFYNTLDKDFGYNLKSGGHNTHTFYTEDTRRKMSCSMKKYYEENSYRREIQRNNALKQWSNKECKDKITGKNHHMYGKHHTEEARNKIRNAKIGSISSRRNTTPVFCVELNMTFKDATCASKELNLDSSCILKVCRGERKTCGGFHWNFLNLENNIS